jgi:flagellar hook assembly protein FlgD
MDINLSIVDLKGLRVKNLGSAPVPVTDDFRTFWDGTDEKGDDPGAGVYILRIQIGSDSHQKYSLSWI